MKRTFLLAGMVIVFSGLAQSQSNGGQDWLSEPGHVLRAETSEISPATRLNFSFAPAEEFGGILYISSIRRHRLQGKWESWYTAEQACDSGAFYKGLPDGEWRRWSPDGQLLAIRTYDAEKLMRIKAELGRANSRQASYRLSRIYMKNKYLALRYLQASYSFPGSRHLPSHFSLKEVVEHNTTPGNTYQPVFDECLHQGLYMNFFPDGSTQDSGYYRNGLREGFWLHRNAGDRSVLIGTYANGVRQGTWKLFNAQWRFYGLIVYDKAGKESWRKKIRP